MIRGTDESSCYTVEKTRRQQQQQQQQQLQQQQQHHQLYLIMDILEKEHLEV